MRTEFFLRRSAKEICWICGSAANPTREHKFKASYLRRNFRGGMYVGIAGADEPMRLAQGVRSKHLKFRSVLCEACNTSVTQESDCAFEEFVDLIESTGADDGAVARAFDDPRFRPGGRLYTPLRRYFGKLIGCHLADNGAPVPLHLSRFVAKLTDEDRIWMEVRRDPTYGELRDFVQRERVSYAAHGGLAVITTAPELLPSRAYSTATVGPLQFMYCYHFAILEVMEMQRLHWDFIEQCAAAARQTMEEPSLQADLVRLGL
jgi:hypothetical protein